jgi:membrane protease YdiL (CAAX protease family)
MDFYRMGSMESTESSISRKPSAISLVLDAGGLLLLVLLVQICGAFVADAWASPAGLFVVSAGSCGAVALLVRERARRGGGLTLEAMGWRSASGTGLGWVIAAAAASLAVTRFWMTAGLPTAEEGPVAFFFPGWLAPDYSLVLMFGAIAANAALEELIFRSYLIPRFAPALGTAGALLMSSVLFGLAHGGSAGMHVFTGLVWGACFLKTRSIVGSCGAHILHNFAIVGYAYALSFGGSG